jgi:hypothetical protein
MTPEIELNHIQQKQKRKKRDLYFFVAGFIVCLAMVGLTLLGNL